MSAEGYCWSRTSERQVLRIRYKYLEAILRQEVAFFDSQEATTSEIINSISKDTCLIQEVLSEKVIIAHEPYQSLPFFFFFLFGTIDELLDVFSINGSFGNDLQYT